jgi:hypothetical protein
MRRQQRLQALGIMIKRSNAVPGGNWRTILLVWQRLSGLGFDQPDRRVW